MNFKENKFLTLLGIITLVLFVVIIFFGWKARSAAAEASTEIESKKSTIQRLERGSPYPSISNQKAVRQNLEEVRIATANARDRMLTYLPAELTNTSPAAFTALFDETEEGLLSLYEEKGIALPPEWHVGFETYKTTPVKEAVTGLLSYEMKAFEWLFQTVAESGVSTVNNFYRQPLPPEVGKEWGAVIEEETPKRGKRPARRQPEKPKLFAKSMPFELTVSGREAAIRQLLAELSDSPEYFITLRAVRIQNESTVPPNQKQVEFAPAAGPAADAGDPFGGAFVFPDAVETPDPEPAIEPEEGPVDPEGESAIDPDGEPAPPAEGDDPAPVGEPAPFGIAEPADSGRILQIVAGDEKITAFIRGEIILFEADATLPGEETPANPEK